MSTTPVIETDVLRLLRARRAGDQDAARELFELLYAELRSLAQRRLSRERAGHTLAPTSLVHEVFLRLQGSSVDCRDREEFLRLAATVMRHVLVENARRRQVRQRTLIAAAGVEAERTARDAQVLRLDEALTRLGRCDAQLLRVVELRFLVGLDVVEAAAALAVSTATVKRAWRTARAFLHREISRDD